MKEDTHPRAAMQHTNANNIVTVDVDDDVDVDVDADADASACPNL